jgi:hypothetical protein
MFLIGTSTVEQYGRLEEIRRRNGAGWKSIVTPGYHDEGKVSNQYLKFDGMVPEGPTPRRDCTVLF